MKFTGTCGGKGFTIGAQKVGGLSSGRSFIGVVFHHDGLSLWWSFIWMAFLQGSLHQGGLSSRYFIRVVSQQGSLSLGWSFIRIVFH